ncbi:MAG: glycosyltransferase family 9 protein [Flavobacteriales bacterium]|nr:glycosyltransferase family 9 protein [Flavobacteriales bacterium]
MSTRPTRILVIRFSSIGDVLLSAPALVSLRAAIHGPCEIHFLTKSTMRHVAEGFGALVDGIHTIDRATSEVTEVLKAAEIDYIVDLHSNVRSRAIKRAIGCVAFTLKKENLAKWMLVRGWQKRPVAHIVERYIDSFRGAFGANTPDAWPAIFESAVLPSGFDRSAGPWEIIAVGAAHTGKQMPLKLMQSLILQAQANGHRTVLIGGNGDAETGGILSKGFDDSVVNLVGKTSIGESAALIRAAERAYSGDTGMMHLAAAMGTPVTSIWGCTRPSLGMSPWRPTDGSIAILPERRDPMRPCSKLGNHCRFNGESECMHQHTFAS